MDNISRVPCISTIEALAAEWMRVITLLFCLSDNYVKGKSFIHHELDIEKALNVGIACGIFLAEWNRAL